MSLRFFIIPLLVFGFPNFSFAALATGKRLVEIELRQTPVCVDVRKLAMVGRNRRRMTLLLNWREPQYSFSLLQFLLAWILSGFQMLGHMRSAAQRGAEPQPQADECRRHEGAANLPAPPQAHAAAAVGSGEKFDKQCLMLI